MENFDIIGPPPVPTAAATPMEVFDVGLVVPGGLRARLDAGVIDVGNPIGLGQSSRHRQIANFLRHRHVLERCPGTITANWTDGKTRKASAANSGNGEPVGSDSMDFDRTTTAIPNVPLPRPAFEFGIPAYRLTEADLRHITLGELDPTAGGHLWGIGRDKKTEFPQSWSREKIEAAAQSVLDAPQWVSSSPDSSTIVRYGVTDDVLIFAQTFQSGGVEKLVHLYPVGGDGVYKNVDGTPQPWGWDKVEGTKLFAKPKGQR